MLASSIRGEAQASSAEAWNTRIAHGLGRLDLNHFPDDSLRLLGSMNRAFNWSEYSLTHPAQGQYSFGRQSVQETPTSISDYDICREEDVPVLPCFVVWQPPEHV